MYLCVYACMCHYVCILAVCVHVSGDSGSCWWCYQVGESSRGYKLPFYPGGLSHQSVILAAGHSDTLPSVFVCLSLVRLLTLSPGSKTTLFDPNISLLTILWRFLIVLVWFLVFLFVVKNVKNVFVWAGVFFVYIFHMFKLYILLSQHRML